MKTSLGKDVADDVMAFLADLRAADDFSEVPLDGAEVVQTAGTVTITIQRRVRLLLQANSKLSGDVKNIWTRVVRVKLMRLETVDG